MSSLEKCLYSIAHCFDWVCFLMLSCVSCLYILEISPLSVASFTNIFSHSVSSFCFVIVSFAVQKLLSLIRSHLFIFVLFFFINSRRCIQEDITEIYVSVLPMFSS